jgi:hypothetical protein
LVFPALRHAKIMLGRAPISVKPKPPAAQVHFRIGIDCRGAQSV